MIERPQSEWAQRANRRPTSTTCIIYRSDGTWMRVQMTNLSYDGCRILTERRLDVGETLELVVPSMQHVKAQVRWAMDDQAGLRFLSNANAAEARRARLGV